MINHTCLTPPTGVPVDVMTHCACELVPPVGCFKTLPTGQVVDTAGDGLAQGARNRHRRQRYNGQGGRGGRDQHRSGP